MSDTLKVDPERMRGVIAGLRTKSGELGGRVSGLAATSRTLVDDQWSGEASDAYRGRQTQWNTSMGTHHSDLVAYVALLGRIVERYEAAEDKVIALCGS